MSSATGWPELTTVVPFAHALTEPLKGFGRAYLWMLPGILLSWAAGGFHSGGWGVFTPLVFAGAAKAEGLHAGVSSLRLVLHRGFSFIGIAVGVGLVFFMIGLAAWWLAERSASGSAVSEGVWLVVFVALAWWPMLRLWLAPALPFVVHEGEGGQVPSAGFLWIGPGMFSSFCWSRIPGQARKGAPVLVLICATLAIYTFSGVTAGEAGSERLPLATAFLMGFCLMPLTVHLWVRGAFRAHRAALAYESRLGRIMRSRAEEPELVPPPALLDAGIEVDDPHWVVAARHRGADLTAEDKEGNALLHRAAALGSTRVVATLVRLGAAPNALNDRRMTPLAVAAERGHAPSVSALVGQGADLEGAGGRRPLCVAARARQRKTVAALLSLGAVVNPDGARSLEDWPLLCALRGGDAWIVDRLLLAGARPLEDAVARRRLLREAAGTRDPEIVRRTLALFDDAELARELPDIRRWTRFEEFDRPSGYRAVNAVLDEALRRLRPDLPGEPHPGNGG